MELSIKTSQLEEVCSRHQLGCNVLEDFDSLAQIQAVIGSSVKLVLPLEIVGQHIRTLQSYVVRRNNMTWLLLARTWNVNIGELRALNTEKLQEEWRGPNFLLYNSDIVRIPDNATSLQHIGRIRYFCTDPI